MDRSVGMASSSASSGASSCHDGAWDRPGSFEKSMSRGLPRQKAEYGLLYPREKSRGSQWILNEFFDATAGPMPDQDLYHAGDMDSDLEPFAWEAEFAGMQMDHPSFYDAPLSDAHYGRLNEQEVGIYEGLDEVAHQGSGKIIDSSPVSV